MTDGAAPINQKLGGGAGQFAFRRVRSQANPWRWLRKMIFAVMVLALVALTAGMTYEALGRLSDARRFPVRGRMADIGGYRLNLNCTGSGSATVILDSGLGDGTELDGRPGRG